MLEKQYLIDSITVMDTWRMFKILAEFVDGFETLSDIYPCVSIFGSARSQPGEDTYEKTVVIARKLAENGFNIITGGGPGIMEAGNKGAREGGGKSAWAAARPENRNRNKSENKPAYFIIFIFLIHQNKIEKRK